MDSRDVRLVFVDRRGVSDRSLSLLSAAFARPLREEGRAERLFALTPF